MAYQLLQRGYRLKNFQLVKRQAGSYQILLKVTILWIQ